MNYGVRYDVEISPLFAPATAINAAAEERARMAEQLKAQQAGAATTQSVQQPEQTVAETTAAADKPVQYRAITDIKQMPNKSLVTNRLTKERS